MKKIFPYLILFLSLPVFSQVKIGENTGISNPSAALEFTSPNKGILLPAHSASAVPNATNGLLRFNPQQNQINYFSNSWQRISDSSRSLLTNYYDISTNADNDYFKIINEDNTLPDVQTLRLISKQNTINVFNLKLNHINVNTGQGYLVNFPVRFSRINSISKLDFNFPYSSPEARALTITSAGHVGIWENDPQATLHLSVKLAGDRSPSTNTFLLNSESAGVGKILRTNTQGLAYWETYVADDYSIDPANTTVVQFTGVKNNSTINLLGSSGTNLNLISSHPVISKNGISIDQANHTISFADTKYEVYFMVRTGNASGGAADTITPFNIQLVPTDLSEAEATNYGNALAISHIILPESNGQDVVTSIGNFYPEPNRAYQLLISGKDAVGSLPLNNVYAFFLKVY